MKMCSLCLENGVCQAEAGLGAVELEDSSFLPFRLLLSLEWTSARRSAELSLCTRSLYWPHLALQSMSQRKFAHTPKTPKFIPYEMINFTDRSY